MLPTFVMVLWLRFEQCSKCVNDALLYSGVGVFVKNLNILKIIKMEKFSIRCFKIFLGAPKKNNIV